MRNQTCGPACSATAKLLPENFASDVGGTSTIMSIPPESISATRVFPSVMGRKITASVPALPSQCPSFLETITASFDFHVSNLNAPVPTGLRPKSLPYFFIAAGEAISPVG